MTSTKKYYVSTTHKGYFKSALVSSANSKGAAKKFLMHTDPEVILHSELEKITNDAGYKEYSIEDYIITVKRLNIYDDFTPLDIISVGDE